MKKTVLAAVLGSLVSATAYAGGVNTTEFEAPEVYGQIGVSYDNVGNVKDDINYLRNTELGARGAHEVMSGVVATYNLTLKAEESFEDLSSFDRKHELEVHRAEVGFSEGVWALHGGKIDSRYDLSTRKMDVFGDTFDNLSTVADFGAGMVEIEDAFRVYDEVGTSEGLALSVSPFDGVGMGLALEEGRADGAELGDYFAAYATYTGAGVDLSVAHEKDESFEGDKTATKFGAGYDFSGFGVKGLYVGAVHEIGEVGDVDSTTTSFSTSYQVIPALSLKAGYAMSETEFTTGDVDGTVWRLAADYSLSERMLLSVGYADVEAEDKTTSEKQSDDVFTAGITYKF